jgi:hypothetical protein
MTGFFCLSVQCILSVSTGLSCRNTTAQEETEAKNTLGAKNIGRVGGSASKTTYVTEGVR